MRGWLVLGALGACMHEPPAHGPIPELLVIPPAPASTVQSEAAVPARYVDLGPSGVFVRPRSMRSTERGESPFDEKAALAALKCVSVRECARSGGPSGSGEALVAFDASGEVVIVVALDYGFRHSDVGHCVAQALGAATVPPYLGKMQQVRTRFTVP